MVRKIRPVSRIVKIEAEIDRIFGEFFSQENELFGLDESWVPCVDISEKGNEVIVAVELPGVAQKDITILLHSNRLEIKGVKREKRPQSNMKYHRLEREYGTFRRFVFLPSAVVPERSRALLENGILTIILKKFRRKKEKEVVLKVQKPER
ncbi:MAG: Hsp20/alpha crystallin family protein [Candidatus Aminicenantes bacterium]|nr:Hsp20/alpha crystallin family protein [Candidatus Aminicenantes bacterium]